MPLIEEFTSSGHWLFRWRSYLPLVVIVPVMLSLAMRQAHGDEITGPWWEAGCLVVSLFGFAIRAYTVAHTPARTSGRNTRGQVADTLNTTGSYSMVRHPLYLGNFFMGLGVALSGHLAWLVLIYGLVFWIYYERIMFAEEAFLRANLGDEYLEWGSRTPAFIPDLRRFTHPALPFSLRNVLRREYNGLYAVIVTMASFEIAGAWGSDRVISMPPRWAWMLGISTVAWLAIRFIKRHTDWFKVAGR